MATLKRVMAFGLAGMIAVDVASELQAAPVLTTTTTAAALNAVMDVRWHGWRARGWWGPRVAIGGLALGVAAPPYYYGGPYYYPGPYHYRCVTNDGQRRFRPCEQGGN